MSPLATLSFRGEGDLMIARIEGEVDASSARDLREPLLKGVSNQTRGVVLDLAPTRYLDSAGVQLIFEFARRLSHRQIGFRIVAEPRSFVGDVLDVVKIDDVAQRVPDVHTAVRELAGLPRSVPPRESRRG
jgi:anti-anti-sigma factor